MGENEKRCDNELDKLIEEYVVMRLLENNDTIVSPDAIRQAKQAIVDYHNKRVQEATKPIREVQEKYKRSNYDTYDKYKIAIQGMNYTLELEAAIKQTIANVDKEGK